MTDHVIVRGAGRNRPAGRLWGLGDEIIVVGGEDQLELLCTCPS